MEHIAEREALPAAEFEGHIYPYINTEVYVGRLAMQFLAWGLSCGGQSRLEGLDYLKKALFAAQVS